MDFEMLMRNCFVITTVSVNIFIFLFSLLFAFVLVSTIIAFALTARKFRRQLKEKGKNEMDAGRISSQQASIFSWRLTFLKGSCVIFFLAFCMRIAVSAIRFFDTWCHIGGFSDNCLIAPAYYHSMSSYKFIIYALVAAVSYLVFKLILQRRITLLKK